jgi:small subunit ribosomal protein S21
MPSVTSKKSESVDSLLRRFKRACEKASILQELKRRARHVKRTKIRAQEKAAAIKRRIKQEAKAAPTPSRGVRGKVSRDKKRR